jgi:cell wall-associated NlpC family hydrolase
MIKKISVLLIIFQVILVSCGSSRSATKIISNKTKLESQFRYYKGTKYKYGGMDKKGFDCSGFTKIVYKNAFKVNLPRTTKEMSKLGKKVSKKKLKPGDLVFFRPTRRYRHVGIYIGDNAFIHSATSKGVIKTKLDDFYWKKKYRFAKRILKK